LAAPTEGIREKVKGLNYLSYLQRHVKLTYRKQKQIFSNMDWSLGSYDFGTEGPTLKMEQGWEMPL
jgi:hypothetical protein